MCVQLFHVNIYLRLLNTFFSSRIFNYFRKNQLFR